MKFTNLSIPDIILIEPTVRKDERGFFMEIYQEQKLIQAGLPGHFVQENQSGSRRGVLRGMHYQIQQAQGKLLRVLVGEIYDVAVDIRKSSPTFGRWVGARLSRENTHQLWVPPGFAHGFYVLSEWAELLYKVTDFWAPQWERTLMWNDPQIGIDWSLVDDQQPVLSEKDALGKTLAEADLFD